MPTSQLCDYNGNRNTLSVLFKPLPGCSLLVFWFLILLCRTTPTKVLTQPVSKQITRLSRAPSTHQLQLQFLFFHVFPVPGHLLDDCFPFGPSRASSDSHSFCYSIHLEELHSQRDQAVDSKKRGKTWVWMKIAPKRILKMYVQSLTVQ